MGKRPLKTQKTQSKPHELVVVTLAANPEQARDYETLLKTNDIPTIVKEQNHEEDSTKPKSFAVMVPEDFLDEAHVVIESQDAYDDFYDLAAEDEDDGIFDDNFLDDGL